MCDVYNKSMKGQNPMSQMKLNSLFISLLLYDQSHTS